MHATALQANAAMAQKKRRKNESVLERNHGKPAQNALNHTRCAYFDCDLSGERIWKYFFRRAKIFLALARKSAWFVCWVHLNGRMAPTFFISWFRVLLILDLAVPHKPVFYYYGMTVVKEKTVISKSFPFFFIRHSNSGSYSWTRKGTLFWVG